RAQRLRPAVVVHVGGGLEPGRQPRPEPHSDPALRLPGRELGDRRDGTGDRGLDPRRAPRRPDRRARPQLAHLARGPADGRRGVPAEPVQRPRGPDPDRGRSRRVRRGGPAPARGHTRRDRVGPQSAADLTLSDHKLFLKPRSAVEPVPWEEIAVDAPEVGPLTPLEEAQFVALDVETTGNAPFLVLELGAERFTLEKPLSFFDTLVDCRAPINPYAKKRHHIDRSMLIGAPVFKDARRAFLRFSQGAVLVEHSHDAFDTWLVGRGLESPLEHPIIDTTALARLVMELPKGQVPGLQRLVTELELDIQPAHAALDDARATAMVFRALIARAQETLGFKTVGDVVGVLPRPVVDRTGPSRRASAAAGRRPRGAQDPTAQPRSDGQPDSQHATSPGRSGRRGRSSRRRRSDSSGSPGEKPAGNQGA